MPVFYATDRNDKAGTKPVHWGRETSEFERFGLVDTSILRSCATLPAGYPSWWPQHQGETAKPRRYFLIHADHSFADEAAFMEAMTGALATLRHAAPARPRQVILYIHGFNNNFEQAASRSARFAFDLGEPAVPVIYSWPSQESVSPARYVRDATRVQRSQPYIRELIRDIIDKVAPDRFHIIADSMGNRATLTSLLELSRERPDLAQKITSVTLLAPDVDQWVFRRTALHDIARFAGQIMLVTDSRDVALGVSEHINGSINLGTWKKGTRPFVDPAILTLDTSNLRSTSLHHWDFETNPAIMREIQANVAGVSMEQRRCLERVPSPNAAPYYVIITAKPGCPEAGPYPADGPHPPETSVPTGAQSPNG